jgi:hypothetical protein
MKLMKIVFIVLILSTVTGNAEVFKCKSSSGEFIYQPKPCLANEIPVGQLKIKEMTPEEAEKAKALRKTEEEEEAAYDAEQARAEKERQSELARQQELDLQQRRTKAIEDEANAVRNRMWRPPQPIYR